MSLSPEFPIKGGNPAVLLVFAAVWSTGWLVFSFMFLVEHLEYRRSYDCVGKKGVVTRGRISDIRSLGSSLYMISYRFCLRDNNPNWYTGSLTLNRAERKKLRPKKRVNITYCPDNPAFSILTDYIRRPPTVSVPSGVFFGILASLIGFYALACWILDNLNRHRLTKHGIVTNGSLVRKYRVKSLFEARRFIVIYYFYYQKGNRTLKRYKAERNKDLFERKEIGDALEVRYVKHRPEICEVILASWQHIPSGPL